jgi:hypothetical protein
MDIKGNGRDIKSQKLKYNWHSQGNKGQITFMSNGTQAADFECEWTCISNTISWIATSVSNLSCLAFFFPFGL